MFYPTVKDLDPKNGIKLQQKLVTGFVLPSVTYLSSETP